MGNKLPKPTCTAYGEMPWGQIPKQDAALKDCYGNTEKPSVTNIDPRYELVRPRYIYGKEYEFIRSGNNFPKPGGAAMDAWQCLMECERTPGCVGVQYHPTTRACFTKKGWATTKGLSRWPDARMYYKG